MAYVLITLGAALIASSFVEFAESVTSDNRLAAAFIGRGTRVTVGILILLVGGALLLDLSWMRWTTPTAVFFIGLFSLLAAMTVWDIVDPTGHPKGFLPIAFSRGERLFLSFMIFFGVMILWVAFGPTLTATTLGVGVGIALVLIAIVAKFG